MSVRPWLLPTAALVILCAVLVFYEPPAETMLWSAFFNAGHAPLFGSIALILVRLLAALPFGKRMRPISRYLLAGVIAISLGFGTEIVQGIIGRDAEMDDAARDAAGAISFLLIAATFDRNLSTRINGGLRVWSVRLVGLALFGLTCLSLAETAYTYIYRDHAFPTLASFHVKTGCRFFSVEDAELKRVTPPETWNLSKDHIVGEISFCPANYSTVILDEPYSDWRGYEDLAFSFFSPEPSPFQMTICVRDKADNGEYNDRFNGRAMIYPGPNRVQIPLGKIASGPTSRRLDLASIHSVDFFVANPADTMHLYLDSILLER